jgi:hypothetical protein
MDATPFYSRQSPLRFRGVKDSLAKYHLEGSECCLIHADNPLTPEHGIWLNSRVRVGYNLDAYKYVHSEHGWLSTWDIFFGTWENRVRRWVTTPFFTSWTIESRVGAWEKLHEDHFEPGRHCLINEMQVLAQNGWAHV